MEDVPNEHRLEKEYFSNKKPNQFLQRMKSKSELHSMKEKSVSIKEVEESVYSKHAPYNNGDQDDHNLINGFFQNIQMSKFSNNMTTTNLGYRH